MEDSIYYPVGYDDGRCQFRAFKLKEATKFAKLSKVMRNPIKREEVQFKTLVDIFAPIFKLEEGKSITDLDLMAFRELAIMSSSYSTKEHATFFSFVCDSDSLENPEKDTKNLILNSFKKDSKITPEEIKSLEEEIAKMPDLILCNYRVRGSISFDKLGTSIPNLYERYIEDEKTKVHYYTVGHKLILDELELEHTGHIVTLDDLSITEDIDAIDLTNLKKDYKIVFDILKIALHLVSSTGITKTKVIEKYNELVDCDASYFQSVNEKVREIIEQKPKMVKVECPNCGAVYSIRFDVEDFKLIPD